MAAPSPGSPGSPDSQDLSLPFGPGGAGRFLSGLSRPWAQARVAVIAVRDDGHDPAGLTEVAVVMIVGGRIGVARSWRRSQDRDDAFGQITAALITAALAGAEIVAGHHVRDQLAVLSRALPGWQPPVAADTFLLARHLRPALPGHGLPALADALGLHPLGTPPIHGPGVIHDAVLTARLLLELAEELPDVRSLVLAASPARGTGGGVS